MTEETAGQIKLWHFPNGDEPEFATAMAAFMNLMNNVGYNNPWNPVIVDKMEVKDLKEFRETVEACRFFYRRDPIVATTVNKLVEMGINEIHLDKNSLTENEFRIFEGLTGKLREYAEALALEYLISGLVIPEIKYGEVSKSDLKKLGIKKYNSLTLPVSMWVRDPETIKINSSDMMDQVSYYVEVPQKLIDFIKNKGVYPDGTKDEALYSLLLAEYSEFVSKILDGETLILLENDNIFRRKPLSDSPYPTPYLFAALESLKHKRNLRRMDYSIAARVISAIQLITLGDKDFPLIEGDQEQITAIKNQMMYRNSGNQDLERIFQLFGNHTLKISWVYPPVDALLNDNKYAGVNQDIIYALGFPRILITGETEKSGTGNQEFAMMSPKATIDNFREKVLNVLKDILYQVMTLNRLADMPNIRFEPLTLFDYQTLLKSLADLYAGGNISRTSYAKKLGYTWKDEMDLREDENKVLEEKELEEFAPLPHSNTPGSEGKEKTKKSNIKDTSPNQNGEN